MIPSASVPLLGFIAALVWLAAASNAVPEPLTQPVASDDTIIAHFELLAREGVEEDVAEAYGLELIEQTTLRSLGMRMARYRLPPVATVVERLRADRRIMLAVVNVRYSLLPPSQDTESGVAAKPAEKTQQKLQDEKRPQALKHGDSRRTPSQPSASPDRSESASLRPPPRRADQVAELLAGDPDEARRMRRVCGDILGDPAGYDQALAELCRNLTSR